MNHPQPSPSSSSSSPNPPPPSSFPLLDQQRAQSITSLSFFQPQPLRPLTFAPLAPGWNSPQATPRAAPPPGAARRYIPPSPSTKPSHSSPVPYALPYTTEPPPRRTNFQPLPPTPRSRSPRGGRQLQPQSTPNRDRDGRERGEEAFLPLHRGQMILNRVQTLEAKEDEQAKALEGMEAKMKRLEAKVEELMEEREVGRALLQLSGEGEVGVGRVKMTL